MILKSPRYTDPDNNNSTNKPQRNQRLMKIFIRITLVALLVLCIGAFRLSSSPNAWTVGITFAQDPKTSETTSADQSSSTSSSGDSGQCPDFEEYFSDSNHPPFSTGKLGLPFMRPDPNCRTFHSQAVEDEIESFKERAKDPDLARLFENAYPNTLDTTIKWTNDELTFIVTGDINAEWLRDSSNQIDVYERIVKQKTDPKLSLLIRNIINLQSRYIAEYPYCGAFQPPEESGLPPQFNEWAADATVQVPPIDNQTVFECKYELDSLLGYLKTSTSYYENSGGDGSFLTEEYSKALDAIMKTFNDQSQGSRFDNGTLQNYYLFRTPKIPIVNQGAGEPKKANGMIGTAFRASDDPVIFQFHTADNALAVVQLRKVAKMLEAENFRVDLIDECNSMADRVENAIWEHTIVDHPEYGKIFAYEVNGMGSYLLMDDANVPSLMALPHMKFLDASNEVYQNTRKYLMSYANPYYAKGPAFHGVGGPHKDSDHPWPMNLVSYAITSDDDDEILDTLNWLVNSTSGLGLIHESQSINNASDYTRPWFGWANSYFAEMVLKVADERPHLIFN